jgi:hypothetical protein
MTTATCTSATHADDIEMYGCCDACGTWAWGTPRPAHRITCRSGHGQCPGWHETREAVYRCFVAANLITGVWACGWQYEGAIATGDPDEPYYRGVVECDAPAREYPDGSGFECADGHSHRHPQWLAEHGMAYAEDDEEARYLAKAGVQPLHMNDGRPYL